MIVQISNFRELKRYGIKNRGKSSDPRFLNKPNQTNEYPDNPSDSY